MSTKLSFYLVGYLLFVSLQGWGQTAKEWYDRGIKERDPEKQVEYYTHVLDINPAFLNALNNRGVALVSLGSFKEAIKDYDKVLRIDPEFVFAYFNRGRAMFMLKRYEEALLDFDKALELDDTYVEAYVARGIIKKLGGQYEGSIRDFDEALKLNQNSSIAYYHRGKAKFHLGNYTEAIKDLNQTIKIAPEVSEGYSFRGIIKNQIGLYEESIKDFDLALELTPDDATSFNNRGVSKRDLGLYDEAIRDYTQAIRIAPDEAFYYNNRGYVKELKGSLEAASRDYETALQIDPNFSIALNNLERIEKLLSDTPITSTPRTWVVSIGIGTYRYSSHMNQLDFPVQQAYDFARFMERNAFTDNRDVPVLVNRRASREQIIRTLENTFCNPRKVKADDMIVLYYSGHGESINQQIGICPYDYFDQSLLIADEEILNILNRSPAKHKICFIEACKTEVNPMGNQPSKAIIKKFNERRSQIPGGIVYITSTKAREQSYEYPQIGGAFSHFLMQGLRGEANVDNNEYITTLELYEYLKDRVSEYTNFKQVPQINHAAREIPLVVVD